MGKVFSKFLKDESGATAIEYAMLAGGIAIVIIFGVNAIGSTLNVTFGTVATELQ